MSSRFSPQLFSRSFVVVCFTWRLMIHCFCCIPQILIRCFHSVKNIFKCLDISSLTPVLFRSVVFHLHIFWDFLVIFLLLISSLTLLWFERRLCTHSVLLNWLRHVLWHRIRSMSVSVPSELEENV